MDPPTEQLIRDYLNRVAVAARSSMGPDELRAFLGRLHDSIERQCAAYGGPSTAEVGSALAAMGEPTALVGRERARLAAARAGLDTSSPQAAGTSATVTTTATATAAAAETAAAIGSPASTAMVTGTDSRAGGPAVTTAAPAASQPPVQRRSVTARRKPADILIDSSAAAKNAVRPRGPQGRDSSVLLPLKRNTYLAQDPPEDPAPWRAAQPDPAGTPGTARAFVLEPPQDPKTNVVASPKFQPVREPVAWPASSPGRSRGPERGSEPGASRGPERGSGPGTGLGSEPGADPGSEPGTEAAPEPVSALGAEQRTERGPGPGTELGSGPDTELGSGPDTELGSEAVPEPDPGHSAEERRTVSRRTASSRIESTSIESTRRERVGASVGVFIQRAPGLARQHPLECIAVILLGLGGLIFPPVWLLGALAALPSRLWDIRDKLTGLAAPAVVTIVGGAGLAMGNHTSGTAYFHEALTIGGYLIRAGSVLGAGYLAWRVQRGPRQPAEPPWRRQYR